MSTKMHHLFLEGGKARKHIPEDEIPILFEYTLSVTAHKERKVVDTQ
jgi:hypothetical protein